MSKIKIGINGFGRIGRSVFNAIISRQDIEVVGINDLVRPDCLAYLLKYDSVHKKYNREIKVELDSLIVNNQIIRVTSEKDPSKLAWKKIGAEYIVESTGLFLNKEKSSLHLQAGAKKVIISAPPKDDTYMFIMGVNHNLLNKNHDIVSTASCTTNCLAPIVKILHEKFGIMKGLMTTVHSVTATQKVVDGQSERDWRGGRSALVNIIPSSTGAAHAVGRIIPDLNGKLTGMSFRVPTINVSVVDLTVLLKQHTTYDNIKQAMKEASENELKGILGYTDEPVVSMDFIGDTRSSIFDAQAGIMLDSNFYKIISWYDNETGYSNKLVDLIIYMSSI